MSRNGWMSTAARAASYGRVSPHAGPARAAGNTADPERGRGASPIRSTPITLLARRNVPSWAAFTEQSVSGDLCSLYVGEARAVAEYIRDNGASFFDEIAEHVGMLPVEAEDALAELRGPRAW